MSASQRPVGVASSADRARDWHDTLGPFWRIRFAVMGGLLFVAGAFRSFSDPDLAIHLATGRWVVEHHAVPFVEPFAWTRPGAPFQAYSWLVETSYFELINRFGPGGLACLQGLLYVALAAVIVDLGRAAGWSALTTVVLALCNLVVALAVTPNVRPASVLLIAIPLVWALVYRSLDTHRLPLTLVGLAGLSTLITNSHLLFPLAGAPCVLLLTDPPADRKRILLVPLSIAVGWVLSPYALHWGEVFALNFAPNALFGPPSPINEYKPGFLIAVVGGNSAYAVALFLAILPWLVVQRLSVRSRFLFALLWFPGMLMFALAVRSLIVWWLVSIPLCALALSDFRNPASRVVRTAQQYIIVVAVAAFALLPFDTWFDPASHSGDMSSRFLPSSGGTAIEPITKWLDCFTRHEVGGRLVTGFNYGGYITWRVPFLSESIDGRVIFADSVSRPETYFFPSKRDIPIQPWRTADLAIFPVSFPVSAVLDTASGWRRVAMTSQVIGRVEMIGLWVRREWWERAGIRPLPASVIPLRHASDPRSARCEDLTTLPQRT